MTEWTAILHQVFQRNSISIMLSNTVANNRLSHKYGQTVQQLKWTINSEDSVSKWPCTLKAIYTHMVHILSYHTEDINLAGHSCMH